MENELIQRVITAAKAKAYSLGWECRFNIHVYNNKHKKDEYSFCFIKKDIETGTHIRGDILSFKKIESIAQHPKEMSKFLEKIEKILTENENY